MASSANVQREACLNNRRQRLLPGIFANPAVSADYVPGPVLGAASNEKANLASSFGRLESTMGRAYRPRAAGPASYFILHLMREETEAQELRKLAHTAEGGI